MTNIQYQQSPPSVNCAMIVDLAFWDTHDQFLMAAYEKLHDEATSQNAVRSHQVSRTGGLPCLCFRNEKWDSGYTVSVGGQDLTYQDLCKV